MLFAIKLVSFQSSKEPCSFAKILLLCELQKYGLYKSLETSNNNNNNNKKVFSQSTPHS